MFKINNKPVIDKCIVSFSHNRYESRSLADKFALEKARREIAQKKKGVSHLILRAEGEEIDRLKFLFPIRGIPISAAHLGPFSSVPTLSTPPVAAYVAAAYVNDAPNR